MEILQYLIPFALVQLHQEDIAMEFEGPLLASFKHWVFAIMAEDDSDTFRDYMQKNIMQQQSKLAGVSSMMSWILSITMSTTFPLSLGS